MKFCYTLFALLLSVTFATAQQTVWTGSADQNWSNAANWSNGIPTEGMTAVIPSSATTPVIATNLTLNFQVQNAGNIEFNGTITNTGNFVNFQNASVANHADFTNNGSIQFDNGGVFDNFQAFTNHGNINQTGTGTWSNKPFSSFTNSTTGTFTNNGHYLNQGFFTNNGTFITGTELQNQGLLTNNHTLIVGFGTGKILNGFPGTIVTNASSTFDVQGLLDNDGIVTSYGAFKISATGTFLNDGLFTNQSVARNFGLTENRGVYSNSCATCDTTGIYQFNDYGATFRNLKTFINLGTLELMPCSEFYQNSSTGDPITGRVWLMGIVYEISGTIDESNIMGGVVLNNLNSLPAPTARCKPATVTIGLDGTVALNPALIDNNSTATYCEIASLTTTPAAFNCSTLGSRTVTLTVTDAKGNSSSCNTTVNVLPSEGCPGCHNITFPGVITGAQTICSGDDPAPINNVSVASGGVGTVEYIWIKWTVDPITAPNAFTMIPGTNSASYDPGPLTQTTWFRRCAKTTTCSDFIAETNIIKVTVNPRPAPVAQVSQPTCTSPNATVTISNLATGTSVSLDGAPGVFDQFVFNNVSPGSHTIVATKSGCSGTTTFTVNSVTDNTPAPQFVLEQPSCAVQSGTITITNLPAGYSSKLDNGVWNVNQTVYSNLSPGNHTIHVGLNGCERSAPFQIVPFTAPTPNAICRDITVQLINGQAVITAINIDNGSDAGGCGTIANYSVDQTVFTEYGTYTVVLTVTNSFGLSSFCEGTVLIPAPQPTCPNGVIQNSGFENDFQNWQIGGTGHAIVTDVVHSGTKAALICPANSTGGWITQQFPAAAYSPVSVSFFARLSSAATAWAGFRINWYSAAGSLISRENYRDIRATAWTNFATSATAPAGAAYGQFEIMKNFGEGVFIDDFCVTVGAPQPPVGSCPNSPILNNGFEQDFQNWTLNGTGHAIVTDTKYAGAKAALICPSNSNGGGISQSFPISGGQFFKVSVFGRLSSNQTAWAGFGIQFYDSNWNFISETNATPIQGTTFTEHFNVGTAPGNAAFVNVWVWKDFGEGVFVDGICAENSASQPAPNCIGSLLQNSGFEYNFANWARWGTGTSIETSVKYNGDKSALICPANSNGGGIAQNFVSTPGSWVSVKFFAKKGSANSAWAGAAIDFYDANWNYLSSSATAEINGADWVEYALTKQVPANAVNAQFYVWKDFGGGVYVDDVCVNPGSAPATCPNNLLVNHGFESNLASWWHENGVTIETNAKAGAKAALICPAAPNGGGIGQSVPVAAGQVVSASVWAKYGASGAAGSSLVITFYNSNWGQVGENTWFNIPTSTLNYTQFSHTATAPSGAAWAEIMIWKNPGGGVFVDEFCVTTAQGTTPPPPPSSCNKTALLVVGCTNPLSSNDAWVKSRLEQLGLTVTVKSDGYVTTSDASGKGLVVILSSVGSSYVNSKFTNVNVPVINCEPFLFDDLKMTSTNSEMFGTRSKAHVSITNTSHPIALGLAGNVQIFNSYQTVTFGTPSGAASLVALHKDQYNDYAIFSYETGASMVGLNAPARRVGFFLNDYGASSLTAAGRQLFDNSVKWAMNCTSLNTLARTVSEEVMTFNAFRQNFDVQLKWINNTGAMNDFFEIQRSADGMNFEKIAELEGEAPEDEMLYFNELDRQPLPGKSFYRIRLVFQNGDEAYSQTQEVTMPSTSAFEVFPNPANEKAWVDLAPFKGKKVVIELANQLGAPVRRIEIEEAGDDPTMLDLRDLTNGYYSVSILCEGVKRSNRLIVSQPN